MTRADWAIPQVNVVCAVPVPVGGAHEETRLSRRLGLRLNKAISGDGDRLRWRETMSDVRVETLSNSS